MLKLDHIKGQGDGTTIAGLVIIYLVCVFDKMPQFISNNNNIFLGVFGFSAIMCVVAGFMMVFGKDKPVTREDEEKKEDQEDTDSD